jgi:putative membrane protein
MESERTPAGDQILGRVAFDERLPTYFLIQSSLLLAAMIVGIPFLPFWLLGIGQYVHRRQYRAMQSELTERSLNIRTGFLIRTQKSVPLDKITDLVVSEGPILRALGLCSLRVETAGSALGHAHLPGVVEAVAFRDLVLRQRDRVTAVAAAPAPSTAPPGAILAEIRDALLRIERLLA